MGSIRWGGVQERTDSNATQLSIRKPVRWNYKKRFGENKNEISVGPMESEVSTVHSGRMLRRQVEI